MAKILNFYSRISSLKKRYDYVSLGKESLIELIAENEVAEQVYNSNAIENSTLTLEETEKILCEIDLDRFVSPKELFEAKNLSRVVHYIFKRAKEQELNFDMILLLHKMLLSNISDNIAGSFRKENEHVRMGNHIAPHPKEIASRLHEIFSEYKACYQENMVKRIAILHLGFEYIHPFIDGNGRIGRVINNYLLIRENFVPINIKFIDRAMYYEAFREYDRQKKNKSHGRNHW